MKTGDFRKAVQKRKKHRFSVQIQSVAGGILRDDVQLRYAAVRECFRFFYQLSMGVLCSGPLISGIAQ